MRIECPTCSIGFNVDDSQVGTKGRCPKCETKFIIPADPDDEIEVLEEGAVAPAKDSKGDEKEKKEKPPKKKSSSRDRDDEDDDDEREEKPKPTKREKKRASEDAPDSDDDELLDAGGVGKALGLLALGLVLGLVIGFALGRLTAGGSAEDSGVKSAGDTKDPFGLSEGK